MDTPNRNLILRSLGDQLWLWPG